MDSQFLGNSRRTPKIKILLESTPLKSGILVRRLAALSCSASSSAPAPVLSLRSLSPPRSVFFSPSSGQRLTQRVKISLGKILAEHLNNLLVHFRHVLILCVASDSACRVLSSLALPTRKELQEYSKKKEEDAEGQKQDSHADTSQPILPGDEGGA